MKKTAAGVYTSFCLVYYENLFLHLKLFNGFGIKTALWTSYLIC